MLTVNWVRKKVDRFLITVLVNFISLQIKITKVKIHDNLAPWAQFYIEDLTQVIISYEIY